MGRNLARNLARNGFTVAVHNRSPERTRTLVADHGDEGTFIPGESLEEFVASLERPRAVIIMVKAGGPTDAVIDDLVPLLEEGDIVIDCGNAHFADTRRREEALRAQGLHFVGTGVSGGEEGALLGPSIMPGGSPESYTKLGPMFEAISAKVDGVACCVHVGPDGAGHFVKMVHNGIEYADMQLIAEAYDLLREGLNATPAEIGEIFEQWNQGDLESFLIEITAQVLKHTDAETGKGFVDVVQDQAEQKAPAAGPCSPRWTWACRSPASRRPRSPGRSPATRSSGCRGARVRQRHVVAGGHRPRAVHRGRAPRAVRVEGRRVRAGLRSDPGRFRGVLLGHRPGRDGDDLAWWLHHPGPLPEPHP